MSEKKIEHYPSQLELPFKWNSGLTEWKNEWKHVCIHYSCTNKITSIEAELQCGNLIMKTIWKAENTIPNRLFLTASISLFVC